MANIEITNCDTGSVALGGEEFRDELLVFAGADTFVPGTILARREVATSVTVGTIDRAGSSDGTVTDAAVIAGAVPKVGAYKLTCIAAASHGGVWKLEDPDGLVVSGYLLMTAGSGAATTFKVGGLTFKVTDGTTDFSVGDNVTLTVAADGKLVPFDPDGVGGAQVPTAVLTYEVSRAGIGNLPIRALVAGKVNKNRLIIDKDGDGDNITTAMLDQLRSAGIVAIDVQQLAGLDNQ
jgi:hypothetical protein